MPNKNQIKNNLIDTQVDLFKSFPDPDKIADDTDSSSNDLTKELEWIYSATSKEECFKRMALLYFVDNIYDHLEFFKKYNLNFSEIEKRCNNESW